MYAGSENETTVHKTILPWFGMSMLHQIRFDFVASLPDFAEDNCRVEAIEDSQWHADVHDDNPWPKTKKLELQRIEVSSRLIQCIDRPHCDIAYL
jgi:hypothetical protein